MAENLPFFIYTVQTILLPLDIYKGTVDTIFIEGGNLKNVITLQPLKLIGLGPGIINRQIGIFCIGSFFIPNLITT